MRRSKEAKGLAMGGIVLSKNRCHTPKAYREMQIKFQLLEYFIYSPCKFKGGKAFGNLAYILKSGYLSILVIWSILIFNQSSDF